MVAEDLAKLGGEVRLQRILRLATSQLLCIAASRVALPTHEVKVLESVAASFRQAQPVISLGSSQRNGVATIVAFPVL